MKILLRPISLRCHREDARRPPKETNLANNNSVTAIKNTNCFTFVPPVRNDVFFKFAGFLLFTFACLLFNSCREADEFYDELHSLPQIDNSTGFAYRSSYQVGEELQIVGILHPDNNLHISIGGVEAAILYADQVETSDVPGVESQVLDRVTVAITEAMAGLDREVLVSSGGLSVQGNDIDVFAETNEQSLTHGLQGTLHRDFSGNRNRVYLFCQNGKGDIFYFANTDKKIYHLDKNGEETMMVDLSGGIDGTAVSTFLAGGVQPDLSRIYYSVQTATDYRLYSLNMTNKQNTLLNSTLISRGIAPPYEGTIDKVGLIARGLYPDRDGNLYIANGSHKAVRATDMPQAIAYYDLASGTTRNILRGKDNVSGKLPGQVLSENLLDDQALRYSPDEQLLYLLASNRVTTNGGSAYIPYLLLYDLNTGAKISRQVFAPSATSDAALYNVAARLGNLQVALGLGLTTGSNYGNTNLGFGFLPMPGKRLQTLLYQNYEQSASYGFPKWVTLDFAQGISYAYAPGRYVANSYNFGNALSGNDLLLNYDQAGNLYATSTTSLNHRIIKVRSK